jgi:D-3-phosphoglycerate dehydrogenase
MNIALIGDSFVRVDIMLRVFKEFFPTAQFRTGEVPWPSQHFQMDNEVAEYVGSTEHILPLVETAEVVVVDVAPIKADLLAAAPALRIIGCTRGGPVNVNVREATRRGIPVFTASGRNAAATAEFTVGLLVAGLRHIPHGHAALSQGNWRGDLYCWESAGIELEGKVAGIVGLGSVGQRVARILGKGFGCRILGYDPFLSEEAWSYIEARRMNSLKEMLPLLDILTLHARLTATTSRLIGRHELELLPPSAFIVNTARGGLLDYQALYDALRAGRLAGAALDVFDPEPPPQDDPLLRLPNVTVTPHIGGASRETAERGVRQVARNIANFVTGGVPTGCINAEALER